MVSARVAFTFLPAAGGSELPSRLQRFEQPCKCPLLAEREREKMKKNMLIHKKQIHKRQYISYHIYIWKERDHTKF